ncbi:hypothetical protein ACFX15_010659 [Malus domestica]|uniref:uncharacterized protein LOC126596513 n=1 Tax=Malus sylvestris TaxID=3752 RepID=UPI0021ABEE4D|nr:uncharacterized protein LOC126596513 [Malus sylvestris]
MRRVQCSFTTSTIIFPFRLKGDPSGCGDPDYEFSCVNGKTILEIFPGKYYVHNISYDDQNLRLVDVNFANGSCSLPPGSVKTADGKVMDFRFQGAVIYYASRFRFIKCSKNISSLPTAANYTRVPCLAATNGSYFYAVYVPEYYYPPQPSCSLVAVAPVDYHPDMKFTSYEAVMKLLQAGFDIGWSVKCRDCSLAGKGCAVSSWVKPLTYECYTDAEYKEPTELQIILIYVAMGVGALIGLLCIILILVVVIRRCRRTRNEAKRNLQNQNQQSLTP